MAHYLDAHGHTWHFDLSLSTVERVQARLNVNLFDQSEFTAVVNDLPKLGQVLHCAGNTGEDFNDWCRAHIGDALERAFSAFMEALCDFFQSRLTIWVHEVNGIFSRTQGTRLPESTASPGFWELNRSGSLFASWFGWWKGVART